MNPSSYAIRIRQIPTELKIQPVLTGYNILVAIANAELGNAFDALVKGFTADTPLENRAYTLVSTALFRACRHIYREDEGINQLVNASADKFFDKANRLEISLRDLFEQEEYFLEADFFAAPHRQAFVSSARSCFRRWLESELGLNEARSGIVCAGFSNLFFAEIVQLWLDKKNLFAPIEAHFKDNPFMEASYERAQRASYHAGLKSHYSGSPFGDPNLSLSDIYVEPDFSRVWHDRRRKTKEDGMLGEEPGFKDVKYEGGLHAYLLDWLRGKLAQQPAVPAEKARFMLLLGQPGQGKSSFCYRAMYQLLEEEPELVPDVFFVKLKDILDNDLVNRPLEVLRRQIGKDYCNKKDQTLPTEKLQGALLLLDGLDELYMHKGMTNSDLHEFIDKLSREAANEKDLRVLVTARHHYLHLEKLSVERHLTLQLKAFSYKQQQQWLDKYAVVYPKCALVKAKKNLREIDKSDDYKVQELKNLYNQPILLHLMAKADFVPDLKANKAKIYEFLFTAVIGRRKDLTKYENLKPEHLREFLRVLAWHIFQSDFEYVRKIDFEQSKHLQNASDKIQEKMGLPEGGQPDFLRELLVSFYFKNVHKDERDRLEKDQEEYALEFYHKSLYEYLAAEHAVSFIKKQFLLKDGDDFAWGKRDGEKVLKTMCDFFAKKIFSAEVSGYFIEILQNDEADYNGEPVSVWKQQLFERLQFFYPYLSARDFLADWHASNNAEMPRRPIEAALAVFYTHTIALGSLLPSVILPPDPQEEHLKKTRQAGAEKWRFIPIQSEEQLHFSSMLLRLRRHYPQISILLTYQDLSGAYLDGANLNGANLSGADLSGAYLDGAYLSGANLTEANLSGANLNGANLTRANLSGANLTEAKLNGANLYTAKLHMANLSGANLNGANLSMANLGMANLSMANLSEAVLPMADLSGTDLNGADLSEAILFMANLSGADLCEAILFMANLSGADLSGADLSGADLSGIITDEHTKWENATLDNVKGWPPEQ